MTKSELLNNKKSLTGAATIIPAAFLLFYLPSVLTLLSRDREPFDMTLLNLMMATCYTTIFCLNYFLFVPDMIFRRNRKTLFFITNFIIILFLCSLLPVWFENHGGLPRPRHLQGAPLSASQWVMGYLKFMIRDSIIMVLSVAFAYALCLSKAREGMRNRMLELEAERRNIELLSLKAQLNPHFLFNSLNNIYALIAINPERAQKALHDLSSLLRFMIYDSEAASVTLDKELHFVNEYVRLMALRLNPSVDLVCRIPEEDVSNLHIAPLLFLTLIENAFKHLDSGAENPFIEIKASLDDNSLFFKVANSCDPDNTMTVEKEKSGVGLKNVERQLRLLYPSAYSFEAKKMHDKYFVSLSISLEALSHPIQPYR